MSNICSIYSVTAIDYYTKWPEAAPLKDKTAVSVAKFIYSVICRHGCPEIEISDQGREFVNEVNSQLHVLTGVDHRITSAYHPQVGYLSIPDSVFDLYADSFACNFPQKKIIFWLIILNHMYLISKIIMFKNLHR